MLPKGQFGKRLLIPEDMHDLENSLEHGNQQFSVAGGGQFQPHHNEAQHGPWHGSQALGDPLKIFRII